jgi:hypothetical protein
VQVLFAIFPYLIWRNEGSNLHLFLFVCRFLLAEQE